MNVDDMKLPYKNIELCQIRKYVTLRIPKSAKFILIYRNTTYT